MARRIEERGRGGGGEGGKRRRRIISRSPLGRSGFRSGKGRSRAGRAGRGAGAGGGEEGERREEVTYLGESPLGEDDEETGLAAGSVTDDHEFASDFRHFYWRARRKREHTNGRSGRGTGEDGRRRASTGERARDERRRRRSGGDRKRSISFFFSSSATFPPRASHSPLAARFRFLLTFVK